MSNSTTIQDIKTMSTKFALQAKQPQIDSAVKALESHGFKVKVVDSLVQAKHEVEKIIPAKSEVFTATSVTLDKTGLTEELNSDKYISVRDKFMQFYGQPDKAVEMKRIGSGADYAVGSVHAITEEGHVVVASASGSQLPNYAYGASNVIWVVGSQKIVKDLNEALERIETYTFPLEDERALAAYGINSSINKLLIYRKEPNDRVTIILVRESVGF
jgi:L-lactate utilization protein LutC